MSPFRSFSNGLVAAWGFPTPTGAIKLHGAELLEAEIAGVLQLAPMSDGTFLRNRMRSMAHQGSVFSHVVGFPGDGEQVRPIQ